MPTTFDPSLASAKDRIRFRTADTQPGEMLVKDETIAGLLTYHGDETKALRAVAQHLLAHFGKQVDSAQLGDGVGFTWKERMAIWREIVAETGLTLGLGSGSLQVIYPGSEEAEFG